MYQDEFSDLNNFNNLNDEDNSTIITIRDIKVLTKFQVILKYNFFIIYPFKNSNLYRNRMVL